MQKKENPFRENLLIEARKKQLVANRNLVIQLTTIMGIFAIAMHEEVPMVYRNPLTIVLVFCAIIYYSKACNYSVEAVNQYDLENALREDASKGQLGKLKVRLKELGVSRIDAASPSNGKTALHWAARHKHPDVVQFLLAQGADINKQDHEGNTPAHEAIDFTKGKDQSFRTLMAIISLPKKNIFQGIYTEQRFELNRDYNPTLKNNNQKTVCDLVSEKEQIKDQKAVKELLELAIKQMGNYNINDISKDCS